MESQRDFHRRVFRNKTKSVMKYLQASRSESMTLVLRVNGNPLDGILVS